MLLVDKPLHELLAAFASPAPTPGGGSASAVAAAIGASLLTMVAELPKTRAGTPADRSALTAAAAALRRAQQTLTRAVDDDSSAYDGVVAAYKLPKSTEDERTARTDAIQNALRAATDVPLGVMRDAAAALDQAVVVATHGHRAAASDVGVAVALLRAGVNGAGLNVEINLGGLKDVAYAATASSEAARLARGAAEYADAATAALANG